MASADVLQALPALFSETNEDAESVDSVESSEKPASLDLVEYAAKLEDALEEQRDLIIDFSSLKSCLDPAGLYDDLQLTQPFDYRGYVYELLDKQPERLSLQTLSVRKLPAPTKRSPDVEHDIYARFCYGLMQISTLTELDLSGNIIPADMQNNLQLWNLQNLKKLSFDSTSLKAVPASVGRLRKLEVLSLSKNTLTTLPITLGFCENLKVLNLQQNRFRHIPAVVLGLSKLEELKRLDNPLTERYHMPAPRYVLSHTRPADTSKKDEKKIYNPRSLQTLCTKSVFTSKVDYWKQACLGPLQCKILDKLATTMDVCDHCGTVVFKQDAGNATDQRQYEHSVAVMLVTFCELSGVPFLICACSKECQKVIADKFGEMNIELQQKLDEDYKQMIAQAASDAKKKDVDISFNVPESELGSFTPRLPYGYGHNSTNIIARRNRRHKKRCSIM